ncbi:hypothetical protein HIO71_08315 [Chryseobacterium aquaticum]|uniref:Uncharacterized protein n=1 Tax=Chryseobacterium aquaticum TaxID=452084 RepID=A0A848N5L4_9FLAO|nr:MULTISPECIES: hypothetical protein [Chryseobacterium]NMR34215.1 hypothetical protein [Chryseobacterium aquaticum]NRQ46290.1 hypothetical protein [Chryseobacterium sp. C-204]
MTIYNSLIIINIYKNPNLFSKHPEWALAMFRNAVAPLFCKNAFPTKKGIAFLPTKIFLDIYFS